MCVCVCAWVSDGVWACMRNKMSTLSYFLVSLSSHTRTFTCHKNTRQTHTHTHTHTGTHTHTHPRAHTHIYIYIYSTSTLISRSRRKRKLSRRSRSFSNISRWCPWTHQWRHRRRSWMAFQSVCVQQIWRCYSTSKLCGRFDVGHECIVYVFLWYRCVVWWGWWRHYCELFG